jgi:tRNA dimethylallyltransferase
MQRTRTILIAGPTASGKSALALALAERMGGTVINADSMQVYRELRILTARPSPEDEARVPHRLYGFVPGRDAYSAARFAVDAAAAIAEARAAGRVPIVVGGTGLYFKALLEGLSPIPAVPEAIRAHWRGEAERVGAQTLHGVLEKRDPEMAGRLEPGDSQRIVRALEVLEATGTSLARWQEQPGAPVIGDGDAIKLVVEVGRAALHERCDARFEAMLGRGAIEEVERLAALGLDPALPVMRALGVRPLLGLLSGTLPREAAVSRAKAETRQYAKRQETWIRSNMSTWKPILSQEMETFVASAMDFINSQP